MTRAAMLLVCGACLGGCQTVRAPQKKPVDTYWADPRDVASVRRIMFLPIDAAPGTKAPTERMRAAVLDELAKVQRFEIVPLPDNTDEDETIYRAALRGHQPLEALVALGKRYNVDAVVLGTVTSYRAYPPAHLGLRLQMLSLHSGKPVWAAEGLYDAAEEATLDDVRHYARSYLSPEATMHGYEINLISPTRFTSFVAHRLVGTWRDS
ncbi:MAG: hypothetical protein R3F56_25730 [Planctomycetota bacterium]